MNIGDKVKAKMTSDSFYKYVIGTVTAIKNGYVDINATEVMSAWDDKFEKHPTSCACSAKALNVINMSNDKGAKAPQSNSERQSALKKKRLEAGLVRVEIYATPEHKQKILEFAASLKT